MYAGGIPVITPAQPLQSAISGGALSQRLLATDNSGLSFSTPTGFFYWTVQVYIAGSVVQQFSFFLPHTPSPVDLTALADTAASGGGATLPLTTLGDTLYENATPAPARLPGNTSATKQFLTQTGTGTVSAAPAWGAIAAGDVPTLNQNTTGKSAATDALNSASTVVNVAAATAPTVGQALIATGPSAATWQTVPGVQVLTFTYGASGAVPSSGTFTAGQVAVDQNQILRVCTGSGTPGTWQRAGAQPWQFWVDDYGALGNGQQTLVTIVNTSKVINTTPIGAPSAPSLSNAGSGGSLTAGTYQVEVSFVNRWGESTASTSASIAISGVQPLTITSPTPTKDATGWYAYVTVAGGSTYFRQQAPGSPTPIGASLVLTANPGTSGANPPGSDTTAAQIFNAGTDVGKNIMICGGTGPAPTNPWIDTIASVQSATQATVTTTGAGVSLTGCAMAFANDDRVAIDNCVQAAAAYAATGGNNLIQIYFGNKIYGLGTGSFQSLNTATGLSYNAQIRVPVRYPSGQMPKLEVHFLGASPNSHTYFWVSALPSLNGTTLLSFSNGVNGGDPTYGYESIIGGPQGGTNYNGASTFANVKPVVDNIQAVQPGWSNLIGFDFAFCSAAQVGKASSQVYAPTTNTGGGVNPSNGWTGNGTWTGFRSAFGIRLPNGGNNDDCLIESFTAEGMNAGLVTQADHVTINRLVTVNCDVGIKLNVFIGAHALTINQWSVEGTNGLMRTDDNGSAAGVQLNITMDGENNPVAYDVHDTGNALTGIIQWNDLFRSPQTPTISGASRLKVINNGIGPGHMSSPPSVPATTVAATQVYRDAWITIHTGAGVTVSAVTIDGTATGLTMAASSSLAVRVASGKTIALTYAGGTPTWDWWLD